MSSSNLPLFTSLYIANFSTRLDNLLQSHLQQIDAVLLTNKAHYTWDNLMRPLEDMDDELERLWSPVSHLHAVVNSQALRECYQACLPKLTAYEAAIGQNQLLYTAVKSLDKQHLNATQQKIVEDSLRDFELAGVALPLEQKQRLEAIQTRLSELSNQFENNVLDATQAFSMHITDENRLSGLPAHAIHNARELASKQGLPGWLLNLEFPCYYAVVTYADARDLRETFYAAYITRASDQGPQGGQFDNTPLIDEMLALRHEKALLLGFPNYAALSLETKMADSTEQVVNFLLNLCQKALQQAKKEYQALQQFAAENYDLIQVEPWDIAYLSEKKRQALYAISQEELRAYFPQTKVFEGLFKILNKLYGITLKEIKQLDRWHPEVSCYALSDEQGKLRGYIYIDLFARQQKRSGAWMDSCQSRYKRRDDNIQLPIAILTCNFAKPAANKTATLSHEELITLFHEVGHCLQHVLTQVDYLGASGMSGVEWDAVELPSQIFENWCWDRQALQLLSEHVETGESLPNALLEKLLAAKNFQSAMAIVRQLEFALFDFRIHLEFSNQGKTLIDEILKAVRQQTTVVPIAPYNRFAQSFSHIFAGGYAAGYYSYSWAEVLSSDAFSRFEKEGIFNPKTGRDFLHHILEVGGSKKAAEAYINFRGRPATIDALLRHHEIG